MDKKKKFFTSLFAIVVIEFVLSRITFKLGGKLAAFTYNILNVSDEGRTIIFLFSFIVSIIVFLVFMSITYKEKLKVFVEGGFRKSIASLGIGLAIGFVLNGILCMLSLASGSVQYTFNGFTPLLLFTIIPCFVQCSAEEVMLRGYVSSYLEDNYSSDVVAFTGGVLFIFHHITNMKMCGFSFLFCLNIFLLGILFYYLMKLTKSIWTAFGIHTAWNYTQEFLFGSENSGTTSPFSFFSSVNPKDTFFCNTAYGNEGTTMCAILLIVALVVLYFVYKKVNKNKVV